MKKIAQAIVRLRKMILTSRSAPDPLGGGTIATRINYDILSYLPPEPGLPGGPAHSGKTNYSSLHQHDHRGGPAHP